MPVRLVVFSIKSMNSFYKFGVYFLSGMFVIYNLRVFSKLMLQILKTILVDGVQKQRRIRQNLSFQFSATFCVCLFVFNFVHFGDKVGDHIKKKSISPFLSMWDGPISSFPFTPPRLKLWPLVGEDQLSHHAREVNWRWETIVHVKWNREEPKMQLSYKFLISWILWGTLLCLSCSTFCIFISLYFGVENFKVRNWNKVKNDPVFSCNDKYLILILNILNLQYYKVFSRGV